MSIRNDRLMLFHPLFITYRGVATGGGYIGIYTPKSVTVLFTCGTLTYVMKLQ